MTASRGRTILVVASTVVVGAIVAGVILVGTPARGRLERVDARRVEDLAGIVRAVDAYWARNERLPGSLTDLAASPRGPVATVDPETGAAYEYRIVGEEAYELCAGFALESPAGVPRTGDDFWRHGAGRRCFALDVDVAR